MELIQGRQLFLTYFLITHLFIVYPTSIIHPSQGTDGLHTNTYRSNPLLSVDIYGIRYNGNKLLTNSLSNFYHFDYDEIFIHVLFDITGFTPWNFGNITINNHTTDFGIQTKTMSQIFIIVDGEISTISHATLAEPGYPLLLSSGYHTITILVLNFHNSASPQVLYAFETLTISVGKESTDSLISIPVANSNIYYNTSSWLTYPLVSWSDDIWKRDFPLKFHDEVTIQINNSTETSVELGEDSFARIDANVYTHGSIDLQHKHNNITEHQGIIFFYDSLGLHVIGDNIENIIMRPGSNKIGLFNFVPYGMWHRLIPNPDTLLPNNKADFESIDLIDDDIDSSFDYVANSLLTEFHANFTFHYTTTITRSILTPIFFPTLILILFIHRRKYS